MKQILVLPFDDKKIGVPITTVVPVGGKGKILSVIREYRKGIKCFTMGDALQIFPIQVN